MLDREATRDDVAVEIKGARDVARMDMKHADLPRDHPGEANVGEKMDEFILRRERTPMVAHGDLHTKALRHHEDVLGDFAAHRRGRVTVVARVHPGAHTLRSERANLGEKVLNRARDEVRPGNANDVRRSARDKLGENEFRRTRDRAAFSAAARDMDVLVEEARSEDLALRVDSFEARKANIEVLVDGEEPTVDHQHVANAEVIGRENVRIADESCLGH